MRIRVDFLAEKIEVLYKHRFLIKETLKNPFELKNF